ncbi:deoxycytidylate deaminase [endosymbiont of Acanthamoeba sp. UWC8]|uniref:deoxycytidylate deaminase n=1 Tax=endosymbiont of Acanthamoeba sp. UWC8 TaxID=86106 RepID=UPI0004D1ECF0|nr:dCMP deaminase family protein [endosymbiont of Acanthamoeba sp. UWC8]AIF81222.1 deoxycytidylate deaminase [endosymbiont of Acanthamoeba sp. UWC8]
MLHSIHWDEYFMTMAYLVSMKSKDPSTRVGAVIVGPDKEIRSTGYNGLPRAIADHDYRYYDREYKLLAVNHAEENAILHCARIGVSAKGCTIYTPWIPCSRCAKSIIQAGITEVVYDVNFPGNHQDNQEDWKRSIEISRELMTEAEVKIREFDGKIVKIEGLYKEKPYDLF